MGVFADRDDIIASYEGELTQRQLTFVDGKIVEAEALLRTLVPRLAGDPASLPELVSTNATRAICAAVLRVVRNPAGVSYEQVGGFTTRLSERAATGELFFTPEELAPLRERRRRVGVVGVAGPRWSA